jgi:hypothetical protein
MHYEVGKQKFNNKFLAARQAIATGQEIHFNMYESAFDRVDWTKEPELSWDQLLDMRAQMIAAKNKPIVLNFSGGSDSYTIYKVFERNNIHIDILYMRRRNTQADDIINQKVLEFLRQGIYDKTTKIIVKQDDAEIFASAYNHPDWAWTNHGVRHEFGLGFAGDPITDAELAKILGTDDFISVSGFNKPQLVFDWHGVYSWQSDKSFIRSIGSKTMDCFYISPDLPELHVKQSYMMLHYIRSLHPYATPRDLEKYSYFHIPTNSPWEEYCLASGRFGDLAESSILQTAWAEQKLLIPSGKNNKDWHHQGPSTNWFTSLKGTKTFNNYCQGISSIKNDAVGKYLFTDPTNIYNMRTYNSKFYKLKFDIVRPT